jgi:hypothetical protein
VEFVVRSIEIVRETDLDESECAAQVFFGALSNQAVGQRPDEGHGDQERDQSREEESNAQARGESG